MEKQKTLYAGKVKTAYTTDDKDKLILSFRDDATAFDGTKHATLAGKGEINNQFNAFIMDKLAQEGIKTHFDRLLSNNESVVKKLEMIPVESVIRNIAAGSISRRLGIAEGGELPFAIQEFFYKDDALHDPMINEDHIIAFKWATREEIEIIKTVSRQVNDILKPLFLEAGLLLVDFKLEFGRFHGEIVLGDEFTPDGCRVWDANTKEKLDKDVFRRDLGDVMASYHEIADRLGITILHNNN